jgi:nitrogen fixation NifU-like protein
MLEELYQEIILDHYKHPRNRGKVDPADFCEHEENKQCGDALDVSARSENGKIAELKFDGYGCAICLASASIMTQKLAGKTVKEAATLIEEFLKMMRGEIPFGGKEMGDLKALEGVLKFPVRVKCATLAWHTTQKGIEEQAKKKL